MQQRVVAAFAEAFDAAPDLIAQAPGRVNLIGEHTDYNDGFVLPCAIDFQTLVALRRRPDRRVRIAAADYPGAIDAFGLDTPIARQDKLPWANYVRGVFAMLQQRGHALGGADIAIAGNVPREAGLSSSAALEVAVAQALKSAFALNDLGPTELALVAQQAENQFVGCQCGVMDQLISARAEAGHALLIDCRSLAVEAVSLPPDVAVMIVHSHVRRGLVDSEYNLRRLQCEAAARQLGVPALRDATLEQLQTRRSAFDATTWRRAHHVVTENARTLAARDALAHGDLATMGRLMAASHESMRHDFEITVPAIDRLVEILQGATGKRGGARMTGGGFGGCVVALMPVLSIEAARQAVARDYRAPDGQPATVYVCRPSAGAGLVQATNG